MLVPTAFLVVVIIVVVVVSIVIIVVVGYQVDRQVEGYHQEGHKAHS